MKIYTYYENINFKNQDELVSLWQKSWKDKGFETIILSEKDAQKSNFYEEFVEKISKLHEDIAGKPLSRYGLSCWLRWLAYSTQPEEKFFVSDYDVINHNFNLTEPKNILHLMDDCCPCIASGTPSQFLNLCKKFIEVTEQNKDTFIDEYKHRNFVHFHDQNFFVMYFYNSKDSGKDKSKDRDIELTRDRNFISCPQHDDFWQKPLVHYSHRGCGLFCEKNSIGFNDNQRCLIIKEFLCKE
jgi:hypothetical protein